MWFALLAVSTPGSREIYLYVSGLDLGIWPEGPVKVPGGHCADGKGE